MTTTTNGTEYAKLHGIEGELSDGGFKSIGEFFATLGSGRFDDRIQALSVAASGSLAGSGGVMIPDKFIVSDLHPSTEDELILPMAHKFSMMEGTLHVATMDGMSNANGTLYGGFSAQWIPEGGTFTEKTPTTTKITLNRRKLGLFTVSSSELVSDSQYENELIPKMREAIGDFRDEAFFNGNGVGKPLGFLNAPSTIEVAKETNQAADTIVAKNLDRMYARLHPRLVRRAKWFCNPTCVPELLNLVRTTGTAGQVIPVMTESSGKFYMLGLEVLLTSKLPVLGDSGDIILADASQYGVGVGPGIAMVRSDQFKFQTDEICYRAIWRGDGQSLWPSVFTPRNGDTLSWCVKLGARA